MTGVSPLRELRLARLAREAGRSWVNDFGTPATPWAPAPAPAPGGAAARVASAVTGNQASMAEIPTLLERVEVPGEEPQLAGFVPMEQAVPDRAVRTARLRRRLAMWARTALARGVSRLAGERSGPRRLAAVVACCLGGFALLDIVAGAQGQRTLQVEHDHVRALQETLQLLKRPENGPPLKAAVVTFASTGRSMARVADSTSLAPPIGADEDADAGGPPDPDRTASAEGARRPYTRRAASSAAVVMQPAAPMPAALPAGGPAQPRPVERSPIGRYLDGQVGAASPGVEIDQAVGGRSDPLQSAFIKAEVTAARAPFRVSEIREQELGLGARVAAGVGQTAVWVRAGHAFPNGWALVDVTPREALFLSPEGRVFRVRPDAEQATLQ